MATRIIKSKKLYLVKQIVLSGSYRILLPQDIHCDFQAIDKDHYRIEFMKESTIQPFTQGLNLILPAENIIVSNIGEKGTILNLEISHNSVLRLAILKFLEYIGIEDNNLEYIF